MKNLLILSFALLAITAHAANLQTSTLVPRQTIPTNFTDTHFYFPNGGTGEYIKGVQSQIYGPIPDGYMVVSVTFGAVGADARGQGGTPLNDTGTFIFVDSGNNPRGLLETFAPDSFFLAPFQTISIDVVPNYVTSQGLGSESQIEVIMYYSSTP